VLLAIVTLSYRQTIFAYPSGGVSYIVASENLGTVTGPVAAAALFFDYILSVAVSISSGVSALTSAAPSLAPHAVGLGLVFLAVITLVNLRGVRESAAIFAGPRTCSSSRSWGLSAWAPSERSLSESRARRRRAIPLRNRDALHPARAQGVQRRAYRDDGRRSRLERRARVPRASGAERGVDVDLDERSARGDVRRDHRAREALRVVPRADETVLSQLVHALVGDGVVYYGIQLSTLLVLVLAANTSYSDFPRLASVLARNRFMPNQFAFRGDRLAYTVGILVVSPSLRCLSWSSRAT
jgi:hypothetical protein